MDFQKRTFRISSTEPPFGYPRYKDLNYFRQLAASIYVDMCVTAIIDEVCSVEWEIVAEDRAGNEVMGKEADVERIQDFFHNPNTNKESWEMIVRMMLPDLLELNSGIMVKIFNMFGEMVEICARDGMAFTKNPDPYGFYTTRADIILMKNILGEGDDQTQDMDYPAIQAEMQPEDAREEGAYFQYGFNTGARPIPFGRREIVWFEKKVRTDNLYGRSSMEVLSKTVQTLIYAVESQLEYFNDNSIPPGVLGLEGMTALDLKAFGQQWIQQQKVQDSLGNWKRANHKLPMVNKMPKFERLGFTNQELELIESQKWWSKLVWGCYDEETEILTEDGFKLFKDLGEEKVARVNSDGLEIDFIKPIDKQIYDFDGEMIRYKTKTCDLLVTPEHKMLQLSRDKFYNGETKWEVKEARDFKEGIIPQAGNFIGETIEDIEFKSKCKQISKDFDTQEFDISGDNFCKFMGIWLSDGWVESDNNRVCLCASDVYPENKEFIEKLLNDMKVDYKVRICEANSKINGKEVQRNGLMNYYRFSNKALKDYLIQFGHAKNKYVPKVILNADKKQRELFLDAFMLGDGSKGKNGKNDRYGSMSKNLLNGLQEMLIKNGKSATLFQNTSNDCWELTVRHGKSEKIENKYYSRVIKESVSKEKYKGKVYDVTVPEHHYLIVRRNGRVSISGNCFGITATELGFTEDAKGAANQIVQTSVAKKRIIYPLLRLIEYHVNTEIIPEFGVEGVRYKYKIFDIDEEAKKWGLYKLQTEADLKTINEVRNAEGLDSVEWGDKNSGERSPQLGTNINVGDPRQQDADKINRDSASDRDKMTGKPKGDKPKDVKKATTDSGLTLQPNEELGPAEKKLKKKITDLLKSNKAKVFELLEEQGKPETLLQIKSIDDLPGIIKKIFGIFTFRKVVDEVIKVTFDFGWDKSEKQIDRNVPMNNKAVEFLQEHTFDNIKDMTEEISNDLKAELSRGIINGESIPKLKKRVSKVFDVGDNRAEMIARTETNRAENNGKLLAMKASGMKMKKQWVSAHDERTSELCKHLDGQTKMLEEDFSYGAWSGQSPPSHVNCFLKDTKIKTNNGNKKIQDIKVGDKVLTHKNRIREVTEVMSRESQDYYELEVGTNQHKRMLKVTANHPILTQRGWIKVKDLNSEDFVVKIK